MSPVQSTLAETELRKWGIAAGGQWNSAQKVWALRYDQVVRLGLTERIVPMESDVEEGGA